MIAVGSETEFFLMTEENESQREAVFLVASASHDEFNNFVFFSPKFVDAKDSLESFEITSFRSFQRPLRCTRNSGCEIDGTNSVHQNTREFERPGMRSALRKKSVDAVENLFFRILAFDDDAEVLA